MVYDITEPISFKVLKDWINISNDLLDDKYVMGIVGNKIDLYLDMEVPEEEVVEMAKFYNCPFYLVSAKTMPDKCNEIIVKLVEEYLRRFPKKKETISIENQSNNTKKDKTVVVGVLILIQEIFIIIIVIILIIILLIKNLMKWIIMMI